MKRFSSILLSSVLVLFFGLSGLQADYVNPYGINAWDFEQGACDLFEAASVPHFQGGG